MTADIRDARFREVVGDAPAVVRLATGFMFTEGPIWHPREGSLTFSDIPGNHMRRWTQGGGIATYRKPSNMANGNVYDRQGRMVTCEHATSSVTREEADGSRRVLASHYAGKELNSPNDIVVKSDGGVYFTDPTYGRMEGFGVPRAQDLDFQGVYRVEDDGSRIRLLADDFEQPNGLCFNRAETFLYVNDTGRGHIRRFSVRPDGALSGGEIWAELTGDGEGAPDGLKVDENDNVYCCGPGGLHVFATDATCLGVVRVPEMLANFTWGDGDMRSIFLTASRSLYRVRSATPGLILF